MGAPPHETDGSSVTFTSRKVVCVSARTRRAAVAVVAAATAVTTAWGSPAQAQSATHQAKRVPIHGSLDSSLWKNKTFGLSSAPSGRAAYFVQLRGQGAVDAGKVAGRPVAGKVLSQRAVISGNAERAFTSARGADAKAVKLYTTT